MLDQWILSRLSRTITKATAAFETFEYADARAAIEDFFWNDFCDNYLELVKDRAYGNQSEQGHASASFTLHRCLETLLRLFAPFVPHVTEEVYTHLFAGKGSVHQRGAWPEARQFATSEAAEQSGAAALEVLEAVRKAKSEAGVSIKTPVEFIEISENTGKIADLEPVKADLLAAANANELRPIVNDSLKTIGQATLFYVKVQLGEAQKTA